MTPLGNRTGAELERLVSFAILRAEALVDQRLPARAAWLEVLAVELELAERFPPESIEGGIARAGAVAAALSAGELTKAKQLAERFVAEPELTAERRKALDRLVREHEEQVASRFPALARYRGVRTVLEWKTRMATQPDAVFPWAA